MTRQPIDIKKFVARPYGIWEVKWFVLSSGDFSSGQYNAMVVSWGSLGQMWDRPFVQVVVRPHRFTYQFMEKYPTFTLCTFPVKYQRALNLLGSKSGRDGDKIAKSGLSPAAATCVGAPVYEQAELAIECRKIYWQDFDPSHFLEPEIERKYPEKDYHRIYFGEILAVQGIENYLAV